MKTSQTLIRTTCVLALATALVATGCSKKKETAPTPAAVPAAPATPTASTPTTPGADPARAAEDMAKAAKEKADAEAKAAAQKMQDAAAASALAAKQKAQDAAAAATATTTPTVPTASPAAAAAGGAMDAAKAQAAELFSQYSGELATLKSGAVTLKELIDKNAAMLPAGVATKYQELNTLLPQLTSAVDSLKKYQTADLTTLVPKLKADFATAQKLYTEIKSMLPAM